MQLATAYCQCFRSERPLKKDGTFKQHKDYFNYGHMQPTCEGSGQKPEDVERKP